MGDVVGGAYGSAVFEVEGGGGGEGGWVLVDVEEAGCVLPALGFHGVSLDVVLPVELVDAVREGGVLYDFAYEGVLGGVVVDVDFEDDEVVGGREVAEHGEGVHFGVLCGVREGVEVAEALQREGVEVREERRCVLRVGFPSEDPVEDDASLSVFLDEPRHRRPAGARAVGRRAEVEIKGQDVPSLPRRRDDLVAERREHVLLGDSVGLYY
mmetsp:Transcript_5031/g.16472  ORF Transcript_5031/g.16472 Transcript_5031/m.16472 type:complete len:211 (-) Transcript_5031:450-1082(-)